ncbi:glycosyltransferase family 4 protein [Clostridium sp. DSM 100503]|uniref:glycosyltransferase family 4 protein n=1 Tax=Clostridium sp. DSM 100503 TaxID=2963282 RepID=UPI002149A57A|nr:glycosyltransferase family 4 protein [Clostridium sp. DSM 100503]MCR1951284.1 glycosyltransferase family 4 protein [Clostridium sp. DSM 100503]
MINKSMKRILIISEVFYPEIGSGANRITNLVIQLKKEGYIVDVVTSEPSYPNKEMYEKDGYRDLEKEKDIYEKSKIHRIKTSRAKSTTNFVVRLYKYIFFFFKNIFTIVFRRTKYDLVIATIPSPFVGLLGGIAKVRFRCKYILDIRDLWPECIKNIGLFRKNKFLLKIGYILEKIMLKFADAIVINSNGFRDYLIKNKYKKNIVFIPNGLQFKEVEAYKEIRQNIAKHKKFTVIYTGMIGLPQNVTSLVRIARNLRHIKEIEFKIIGAGIQRDKVSALIEHYNLKNIKLYAPMPKNRVVKEVAKCHVALAHLRKDSGFDLVIPGKAIDYMGIGIPIVAGVEGYAAEVIRKSNSGLVVEPDDHVELAKSIMKIYEDSKLQNDYSINGINYCLNNFCIENNFTKYVSLIEKVTRRNDYVKEDRDVCMESLYQ